jgi:hypothetical protein
VPLFAISDPLILARPSGTSLGTSKRSSRPLGGVASSVI